jgi:predicted acyl esterase
MKVFFCVRDVIVFLFFSFSLAAQNSDDASYIRSNYSKKEVYISMRDGIKLFTAIYSPNDSTAYPILMERTPYSCGPYGENNFSKRLGPNSNLMKGKYIFVYQDVRGRYKSEGNFKEMTPAIDIKDPCLPDRQETQM